MDWLVLGGECTMSCCVYVQTSSFTSPCWCSPALSSLPTVLMCLFLHYHSHYIPYPPLPHPLLHHYHTHYCTTTTPTTPPLPHPLLHHYHTHYSTTATPTPTTPPLPHPLQYAHIVSTQMACHDHSLLAVAGFVTSMSSTAPMRTTTAATTWLETS